MPCPHFPMSPWQEHLALESCVPRGNQTVEREGQEGVKTKQKNALFKDTPPTSHCQPPSLSSSLSYKLSHGLINHRRVMFSIAPQPEGQAFNTAASGKTSGRQCTYLAPEKKEFERIYQTEERIQETGNGATLSEGLPVPWAPPSASLHQHLCLPLHASRDPVCLVHPDVQCPSPHPPPQCFVHGY